MYKIVGVGRAKAGKVREAIAATKAITEYMSSKHDVKIEVYLQTVRPRWNDLLDRRTEGSGGFPSDSGKDHGRRGILETGAEGGRGDRPADSRPVTASLTNSRPAQGADEAPWLFGPADLISRARRARFIPLPFRDINCPPNAAYERSGRQRVFRSDDCRFAQWRKSDDWATAPRAEGSARTFNDMLRGFRRHFSPPFPGQGYPAPWRGQCPNRWPGT